MNTEADGSGDREQRKPNVPTPLWQISTNKLYPNLTTPTSFNPGIDLSKIMGSSSQAIASQILQTSLPDISKLFSAQHQHLLAQLSPNTRSIMKTVFSSEAIRNWQTARPSTARADRSARDFLTSHAKTAEDTKGLLKAIADISAKHADHEPIWRGQGNADWPIRSTLYRAVAAGDSKKVVEEDDLVSAEAEILNSASKWGLAQYEFPATPLHALAELQHAGAPTRLLDVTRDAEVAAWFAVENPDHDDFDGLVIAWGQRPRIKRGAVGGDLASTLLNTNTGQLPWQDWDAEQRVQSGWGTGSQTHVWFPETPNIRMRVQRGGFMIESAPLLLDGIVKTINGELSESTGIEQDWRRTELELATSIIGLPSRTGRATKPNNSALVPIFTIVIKAHAKKPVREYLTTRGLTQKTMYPDLSGLIADLRRRFPT
ncbi:hypothetical protein DEO23_15735 [Brachybacterium endophyticum]|uniref:FRG domain-containing protein n=1 Tax=Brachybacterium endophyticum TaxID=2182385 RepID=A0A2U2RGH2_9MICO|nr:FRG domain-containing protein [Brachybacterium endophyticum]PWH04921.1 hypothetical protein DEO23_15735 [Brachybacterium endophyticum]